MKEPTDYPEDDWLALSGLQHFAFCRRQWALIHIEQQWQDNYLTTAGSLEHDRAHDYSESETRGEPVLGCRILWNTSMVFQSRWMRIVFNFVRKPCVWKKCWLARFRKVACSISRLNDGSGCNLMSRCVDRSSQ